MQDKIIAYHAKSELRGWNEVCRHPVDWDGWNDADRSMIQEIFNTGDYVVTLGWSMWELIQERK
jgi:hypothetical protein